MDNRFNKIYNLNKLKLTSAFRSLVGNQLDNLLNFLSETDFYYSPAARYYHDNYPGGLYDHCEMVFNELFKMRSLMNKNWTSLELLIIAFGHDLCKLGLYIPSIDSNGVITYSYNTQSNPDFHGTESLSILSKVIPDLINKRVANSIVCHMGLWTKDIPEIGKYMMEAQTEDDLVFFTHCADMIASRIGKSAKEVRVVNDEVNITY